MVPHWRSPTLGEFILNAFLCIGQHAAIGVGATVSALAVAPVLGVSLPLLGFTATGIAGSKLISFDQVVIQRPISCHPKARQQL